LSKEREAIQLAKKHNTVYVESSAKENINLLRNYEILTVKVLIPSDYQTK
jgi:hypothetical protein